jgi:hypothetical protein
MVDISTLGFNSLAEWFNSALTSDSPVDSIWSMVIGDNGAMDSSLPDLFHSLKYMSPMSGYWVKINEAAGEATLTLTGEPFDLDCGIPLKTGWNQIGYPSNVAFYDTSTQPDVGVPPGTIWKNVSPPVAKHVFESIDGDYSMVIGSMGAYNPALDPSFNSLHYILPGDALWIKMEEDAELLYPKQ